jgi:hypothetical protein
MKRSEIGSIPALAKSITRSSTSPAQSTDSRPHLPSANLIPDFASLHPGYKLSFISLPLLRKVAIELA